MAMIKAVEGFWKKAINEEKNIQTVFTGEIVIRGNLENFVLGGKTIVRSPQDNNLIMNFKQLKARDLVESSNDKLMFNFLDMGTGAIYTLID